jgi:hypothetical protein
MQILQWETSSPVRRALCRPLFYGQYPSLGEVVYGLGGGAGSFLLGALVFRRLDDQLAVEL